MKLCVKIMDADMGRDEEIGSCKINLENLGLTTTPKPVEHVVDRKLFSSSAVVYLELSYSEND